MATRTAPPFTKWGENDHAGPVIIVTTLSLLYWLVAGAGQQVLSISSGLRYTWADGLFTSSMVMGFVQSVLVLAAASHGLGKSTSVSSPNNVATAESIYKASNLFYILTLGLIKCSASAFTANLTVKNMGSLRNLNRQNVIAFYVALGLSTAWTIGSIVAIAYPCKDYGGRANQDGMCMGTFERWLGIFVGDAITDVVIVAFAASVIWTTKASITTRLAWYIPFLVRACVPLWSGLRLLTIDRTKLTQDPLIGLWLFICMGQVQILLALIGAASPVLKKAIRDLVTNFGAQTESRERTGTGNSFAMKYLRSRRTGRSNNASQPTDSHGSKRALPFSGPSIPGSAMVSRNRREDKLAGDGDSQEGIIRQDDFEVSYFHTEASDRDLAQQETYGKYR